ncbi:MAG: FecR domain-containing protein [Geobacteraceae bacterium]|nr:FecR domain-containing protein [Geobacteraceae bacterium]
MTSGTKFKIALTLFLTLFMATFVLAEEQQVGRFVQLKGQATILRGQKQLQAKVKAGITASDTITTGSASRAKLLFIDDSVLTLSENSKLVIKEFIHSKDKQGKSVYNLLDGKMRSVVGKTRFEVHTPTAVAAARGTVIYFDVGMVNNQSYSKIICLEGNVQIRNVINTVGGQVTLTPGTMVVIKANEPPPPPVTAPPAELDKARKATQGSTGGTTSESTSTTGTSTGGGGSPPTTDPVIPPPPPITPPIQQQPVFQPRKVNINIGIPGQ